MFSIPWLISNIRLHKKGWKQTSLDGKPHKTVLLFLQICKPVQKLLSQPLTWLEKSLFHRGLPWPPIFWLDANMASPWGNNLDIFQFFNCHSPSFQLRKWKLLKMEKIESVTIANLLIYFQWYISVIFRTLNLWKSNLLCRGNSCARCPRQLGLLMLEIRTRPDKESKKCFAIYFREKEYLPVLPA